MVRGACGRVCCPNCWSEGSDGHGISLMGGWDVSALFVFLLVVGGFVVCGVIIGVVVVAGGRFLRSGLVGVWEGRVLWRFAVGVRCWGIV